MYKVLGGMIKDMLVVFILLTLFIAIGGFILVNNIAKDEDLEEVRALEVEAEKKVAPQKTKEFIDQDKYNQCMNKALADYEDEFQYHCRKKVDNNCVLAPETLKNMQDKYLENKKDCQKFKK